MEVCINMRPTIIFTVGCSIHTVVSLVCVPALRQMALHVRIDGMLSMLEGISSDGRPEGLPALQITQNEGLKVTMLGDSTIEVRFGELTLPALAIGAVPITELLSRHRFDKHLQIYAEDMRT